MIQDIQPHQYHNEYRPHAPKPEDYVFSFHDRNIVLHEDGTLITAGELPENTHYDYLFAIDNASFYMTELNGDAYKEFPLNVLRTFQPKHLGFAGITAWQIYDWMRKNRFCGVCGHPMKKDGKERAMRCPECGHIVYPTIAPAVIVGIINEKNQILLTKYSAARGGYQKHALVAGYAEIGEPIEDTVRREVLEETGLHVRNIHYYKSQPWSFSGTLLMGFWCEADSTEEIRMDAEELRIAQWYGPHDETIDHQEIGVSLTGEMIELFCSGGISYGQ